MTIEEQLKNIIRDKYTSIRQFTIAIDEPYSTIDSILKRGIMTASVSTMLKICDHLNIELDALQQGYIKQRNDYKTIKELTHQELEIIKAYRAMPEVQHAVRKLLGINDA